MIARGVVKAEATTVLFSSDKFPTTGYGYVYNLKPELADKIRKAFFSFQWDGSELLKEFGKAIPAQERFMEIKYKDSWAVVRDIDKAMGVKYECK